MPHVYARGIQNRYEGGEGDGVASHLKGLLLCACRLRHLGGLALLLREALLTSYLRGLQFTYKAAITVLYRTHAMRATGFCMGFSVHLLGLLAPPLLLLVLLRLLRAQGVELELQLLPPLRRFHLQSAVHSFIALGCPYIC